MMMMPQMIELSTDSNYLHRMICLLSILRIGEVCDAEVIRSHLLNILVKMSADKVPNVRFKVTIHTRSLLSIAITRVCVCLSQTAQILAKLGSKMDNDTIQSIINITLNRLKDDVDVDVSHFALQAMRELKLS